MAAQTAPSALEGPEARGAGRAGRRRRRPPIERPDATRRHRSEMPQTDVRARRDDDDQRNGLGPRREKTRSMAPSCTSQRKPERDQARRVVRSTAGRGSERRSDRDGASDAPGVSFSRTSLRERRPPRRSSRQVASPGRPAPGRRLLRATSSSTSTRRAPANQAKGRCRASPHRRLRSSSTRSSSVRVRHGAPRAPRVHVSPDGGHAFRRTRRDGVARRGSHSQSR